MSRKRSLAGFDAVANTQTNDNNNININKNANINEIISSTKKTAKKLTGLYLEKEIAAVLDRVAGGTRGAKSEIANTALRQFFEGQGLL